MLGAPRTGVIRAWRGDDTPVKTTSTKAKTGKKTKKATKSKKSVSAKKQPTRSLPAPAGPERFKIRVAPTENQRDAMSELFAGPYALADLLRKQMTPPQNRIDALNLLLQHRKIFEPFLSAECRDQTVDLLVILAQRWGTSPPEWIELNFEGDCSVSNQGQIYLPLDDWGLPTLRRFDVSDSRQLAPILVDGAKYDRRFSLSTNGRDYVVGIDCYGPLVLERMRLENRREQRQERRRQQELQKVRNRNTATSRAVEILEHARNRTPTTSRNSTNLRPKSKLPFRGPLPSIRAYRSGDPRFVDRELMHALRSFMRAYVRRDRPRRPAHSVHSGYGLTPGLRGVRGGSPGSKR